MVDLPAGRELDALVAERVILLLEAPCLGRIAS